MTKSTKSRKKITKITKAPRGLLAYHIAASLVTIAPHPHTGRSVHRKYTSHGVLIVALILTGVLLFSNLGALRAYGISSGASRSITVNIAGAPPSVGADITFPTNLSITKSSQIRVAGNCESSTLVATYRDGEFAGSSMCANDGTYETTIQLRSGYNVLQSQNYDALNQPGPVTAQVSIFYEEVTAAVAQKQEVPPIATTSSDIKVISDTVHVPDPAPAPAPQPSINPCFDTANKLNSDSETPIITTNCVIRGISTGETTSVPIQVSGGQPPYALSINWGDDLTDLRTVLDSEFHLYEHTYTTPGIHSMSLKTTDSQNTSSFLQTVVQVNDESSPVTGATSFFGSISSSLNAIWTEAPVPLYWAAVTLVAGFWIGDIFQRVFSKNGVRSGRQRRI